MITSTIKIDEESIQEAILEFVKSKGYILDGTVTISVVAGRGSTGTHAILTIEPAVHVSAEDTIAVAIDKSKEEVIDTSLVDEDLVDEEGLEVDSPVTGSESLFGQ